MFSSAVIVLAIMDGLNFYWPHNQGFYSLTYGAERFTILGKSMDAWHVLKMIIILILGLPLLKKSIHHLITLALIAWLGQELIYHQLIKGGL